MDVDSDDANGSGVSGIGSISSIAMAAALGQGDAPRVEMSLDRIALRRQETRDTNDNSYLRSMLCTYHRTTAGQTMAAVRACREAPKSKKLNYKQTIALIENVRKTRVFLAHSWRKFEKRTRRYVRARDTARWIQTVRPEPYPEHATEEDRYRKWERNAGKRTGLGSVNPTAPPLSAAASAASLTSTLSRLSIGSLTGSIKQFFQKRRARKALIEESERHLQRSLANPQLLDKTKKRLRKHLTILVETTLEYFANKELLDSSM